MTLPPPPSLPPILIMEKILQLDEPLDVSLLDQIVSLFYEGKGTQQQRQKAGQILAQFQSLPNAWLQVDKILETSNKLQSKFIGLNILEHFIATKWNSLPQIQQSAIFNFLIGMILSLTTTSAASDFNIELIHKADYVLIQILKRNWNESFINDLIESSHASLPLCQNNIYILQIIAEEIFENDSIASNNLTKATTFKLKKFLSKDFEKILMFCYNILNKNISFEDPICNNIKDMVSLTNDTIVTLNKYLNWIPIQKFIDSNIITLLIENFLVQRETTSNTLKCLTTLFNSKNISDTPDFQLKMIQIFNYILQIFANNNNNILHLDSQSNLNGIYNTLDLETQSILQDWEIFLCTFLTRFRDTVEGLSKDPLPEYKDILFKSHQYILQLTMIKDKEMFKIALDYWHDLVTSLFTEIENFPFEQINPFMDDEYSLATGALNPTIFKQVPLKRNFYSSICSQLRDIIITDHMVKPEEFQITLTEDGNFVKEVFTETENVQLYETEREVMVLLTHLDVDDMENILWNHLLQLKKNNLLFTNNGERFNQISWAIGSIAGTMRVETEQIFLTKILNLLGEISTIPLTKEQIIIYSSNVMYIVGRYSRFLKNRWLFFHKVMYQLFEMMHNENDAIRDMACDTFAKICSECKYQMVTIQDGDKDGKPFIRVILENMSNIVSNITSTQLNSFYETCAMIISQERDLSTLRGLTMKLMRNENFSWQRIVSQFRLNSKIFLDFTNKSSNPNNTNNCQALIHVLRANIAVANSLRYNYFEQMQYIYLDMLDIYVNVSNLIKDIIQQQQQANYNDKIIETPQIKLFRIMKREILRLMYCFIQNTRDSKIIIQDILTPFINATLEDYQTSTSELREFELLKCLTIILQKCGDKLINIVGQLFPLVIEPTLMMINKDMISYADHRREYYKLLNVINENCFQVFIEIPIFNFKLFFDSICWAIKHTNREIESLGIESALIMLRNIDTSYRETSIFKVFFQEYYLLLLNETFYILTEPDHKSTFTEQSMLLMRLIKLSFNGNLSVSIYEEINGTSQGTTNKDYLMQYMAKLLLSEFHNLTEEQVRTFLNVLVTELEDLNLFKGTLRDFLVQIREIGGDPTDYLFSEEREKELEQQRKIREERASRIAGLTRS